MFCILSIIRFTTSQYPFVYSNHWLGHCTVCPSLWLNITPMVVSPDFLPLCCIIHPQIYDLWLLLRYLQTFRNIWIVDIYLYIFFPNINLCLSCLNNSMISNLKNKKTRISNKSEWIWNLLFIERDVRFNESMIGWKVQVYVEVL